MTRYKIINGEKIKFTAEEEIIRDQEEANFEANSLNRALNSLREKRNNLLKQTDYFALSDVSMSDDMTQYRKNLRNLTNGLTTVEDVKAVIFPTKPNKE
tara:strand:+ start:666 stop:962 length:297 start_codon:yes stop_codon:yes gene_type:complete